VDPAADAIDPSAIDPSAIPRRSLGDPSDIPRRSLGDPSVIRTQKTPEHASRDLHEPGSTAHRPRPRHNALSFSGDRWGYTGATLGQRWGNAGAMLGQCRGNAGTMLGQCWGYAGTTLGQCRDYAVAMLGAYTQRHGAPAVAAQH